MKFNKLIALSICLLSTGVNSSAMGPDDSQTSRDLFYRYSNFNSFMNRYNDLEQRERKLANAEAKLIIDKYSSIDALKEQLEIEIKNAFETKILNEVNQKLKSNTSKNLEGCLYLVLNNIISEFGKKDDYYCNFVTFKNFELAQHYNLSSKIFKQLSISTIYKESIGRCIELSLWLSDILTRFKIENYLIIDAVSSESSAWHVYNIVVNREKDVCSLDILKALKTKKILSSSNNDDDLKDSSKKLYILDPNEFDEDTKINELKIVPWREILDKTSKGEKIKDIISKSSLTLKDTNFVDAISHFYI